MQQCIKTRRNDSKFTIGKYHINTIEIINLFGVNIFMPVTKVHHLLIWLYCKRRLFQIFGQFRELFKETNGRSQGFCFEKEREKHKMLRGGKKFFSSFKLLGLSFSSNLDQDSNIIFIAKTAHRKTLIHFMKFRSSEIALYLCKPTIQP